MTKRLPYPVKLNNALPLWSNAQSLTAAKQGQITVQKYAAHSHWHQCSTILLQCVNTLTLSPRIYINLFYLIYNHNFALTQSIETKELNLKSSILLDFKYVQ